MSKVTRFLDKDPTEALREFLADYRRTLDVQDRIKLDRLLDELDTAADWYYSQNELNKGRLRHAQAELRLRYAPFWAGVEAVERIFARIADAAREQRWAATAREREHTTEFSAEPRTLARLRSAHEAAKGTGDAGAWEIWDTVADILGDVEIEFRESRVALQTAESSERCNNCSDTDRRLYPTRGNGLVCLRCIRANVDLRPEFARVDGSDD